MEHVRKTTQQYLNELPYKLMVKARESLKSLDGDHASFEDFIKQILSDSPTEKRIWHTVLSMHEQGILQEMVQTEQSLTAKYNEVIRHTMERLSTTEVN
jgi:hypothetical protein